MTYFPSPRTALWSAVRAFAIDVAKVLAFAAFVGCVGYVVVCVASESDESGGADGR